MSGSVEAKDMALSARGCRREMQRGLRLAEAGGLRVPARGSWGQA